MIIISVGIVLIPYLGGQYKSCVQFYVRTSGMKQSQAKYTRGQVVKPRKTKNNFCLCISLNYLRTVVKLLHFSTRGIFILAPKCTGVIFIIFTFPRQCPRNVGRIREKFISLNAPRVVTEDICFKQLFFHPPNKWLVMFFFSARDTFLCAPVLFS